jgi:hypothetical protein
MHRNIPLNRRVPHGALVMLERSAAKVARCVLRGLGEGDLAWLPGGQAGEAVTSSLCYFSRIWRLSNEGT